MKNPKKDEQKITHTLRRRLYESADSGTIYEFMAFTIITPATNTRLVKITFTDGESQTMAVEHARVHWKRFIDEGWEEYKEPKERTRRKKQRVKAAMTDFDKLKNYALEA